MLHRGMAAALLLTVIPSAHSAQNKPRTVHLEGTQARRLVSLLVTGSDKIAASFRDAGKTRIVLHDLMVLKWSTYKYDDDAAMYKLDVYSAEAKIGDAAQTTQLGEATSLFELLTSLGVKPDLSMQGADLDADVVDCRINTHVAFEKPQRFVCDLTLPF